jgi:hypothetical protein
LVHYGAPGVSRSTGSEGTEMKLRATTIIAAVLVLAAAAHAEPLFERT